MDANKERIGLIDTLFATFPREYGASDADIVKRKAVYVAMLQDLPVDAIRLACRKAYLEQDRLPSIASIVRSVRSLVGSAQDDKRVKSWDEAWAEIIKQMYACPFGKTPKWSSAEIESAVNTYGWQRLQVVNAGTDFAVAESQIRRYYEERCKRDKEQGINSYVLSKGTALKSIPRGSVAAVDESKSQTNTTYTPMVQEGINKVLNREL